MPFTKQTVVGQAEFYYLAHRLTITRSRLLTRP